MDEKNDDANRTLWVFVGLMAMVIAVVPALLVAYRLGGQALTVLVGIVGGMGVTVLVSLLVAALGRRRRTRQAGVLVDYVGGSDPAGPIRLSQIPPLTGAESGLAEEAYRRGYRDGWIQAAETMHDLMSDRQLPLQAAYDACWNHWAMTLLPWRLGVRSRIVSPPTMRSEWLHVPGLTSREMDGD
jgi:hypothetical protein